MPSSYKPNRKSFGAFMVSDQVFIAVKQIAMDIRDTAKSDVRKKTGALARGYKVENGKKLIAINGAPRAMGIAFNSDPAAAPDEFGNSRQKGNRTLRRAAGKFGELKGEPG
jgi:hypothetical protein